MNISPISFGGKLRRVLGSECKGEPSRKEIAEHYDKKIMKLKTHKDWVLKVDEFIQNDPDIQQKIKELPKDIEVTLLEHFTQPENRYDVRVNPPELYVPLITDFENPSYERFTDSTCQIIPDKNGEVNKKAIIRWLDKLKKKYYK